MELNLNQAILGKATQIKGKEYFSAEAYITPFLEMMSKFTNNFIFNAIPANQISLTPNGDINEEDLVYNRMWIQAVMPDDCGFDNFDRVVGMVYGLDVRKPICKFYVGGLDRACCNLAVFDPSFLSVQEIEAENPINYKPIKRLLEQTSTVKSTLEKMSNTEVPYDEQIINENLGMWIRNTMDKKFSNQYGIVKVASSAAISAFKLLYADKESRYYVNPGTSTDLLNVYGAFTQILTDDKKDIINKCEKVILISKILGIDTL